MYDFNIEVCLTCPYNMRYVNKECVERCPEGKSYNRYHKDNGMAECLTFYDVLDYVGENNPILQKGLQTNSMGGSLSKPLVCGDETNIITYFSERLIPETDLEDIHFVEMYSNDE